MKISQLITILWLLLSQAGQVQAVTNNTDTSIPNHAVILHYHHVATDTPKLTSVSPEDFQNQIIYLKENNFKIWQLETIIDHLKQHQVIPDKVVAITFDDSYESIYTTAYPILKSHHWPFTIFISSKAIDEKNRLQTSWEQLREMSKNGATIANHSSSHAHLLQYQQGENQQQWQQRIIDDINLAEGRIQQEIGYNKRLFAYPYGENNLQLQQIVKSLGYIGFGQQSGAVGENSNFLALARYPVAGSHTKLDDIALKLHTLPMPINAIKADSSPLAHENRRPTLILEFAQGHGLSSTLRCFGSNQLKLQLTWETPQQLLVKPEQDIAEGRSRYNCTALHSQDNGIERYYWYSHPWVRLDENEKILSD